MLSCDKLKIHIVNSGATTKEISKGITNEKRKVTFLMTVGEGKRKVLTMSQVW